MDDAPGVHGGESGGQLPGEGPHLRQGKLDPVPHQPEEVVLEVVENEDEVESVGGLRVDDLAQPDHVGVDALPEVRDFAVVRQTELVSPPRRPGFSTKRASERPTPPGAPATRPWRLGW